jgi:glutamate-ammonia-ligase adenylyltransferase
MEAAWTWEAQALTRARAVGGDETLAAQFEDIRLKSLQRERDSEALRKDLLDMRERIRKSHGAGSGPQSSVKHGAGGLVDIGFLAQFGVLELAAQHPEVAEPTGAAAQLEKLQAAGWLDLHQHALLQARLAHLQAARIRIELDPGADLAAAPQPDHAAEAVSALFTKLTGG